MKISTFIYWYNDNYNIYLIILSNYLQIFIEFTVKMLLLLF